MEKHKNINFRDEWLKIQYFRKLRTQYREITSRGFIKTTKVKDQKEFIEKQFENNNLILD